MREIGAAVRSSGFTEETPSVVKVSGFGSEVFCVVRAPVEAYFTAIGNDKFARGDQARAAACKAALKLAANENVRVSGAS